MAPISYLASALLMGALALFVFLAIGFGRNWHHYTVQLGRPEGGILAGIARSTTAWIVIFVAISLGAIAATLAVLGGGSATLVFAGAGALVLAFLLVGVYAMGRSRGHPHAYAVGEAVAALGAIFLIALTGLLLTSFGA